MCASYTFDDADNLLTLLLNPLGTIFDPDTKDTNLISPGSSAFSNIEEPWQMDTDFASTELGIFGNPGNTSETRTNSTTTTGIGSTPPLSPEIKSEHVSLPKEAKKTGTKQRARKGRASHNMVEKKYRTNINSKILALRDAVPLLRVTALGSTASDDIDLDGLTPAAKLNKASVLTKATEYIQHLEKKNKRLQKENEELRSLFFQIGRDPALMQSPSEPLNPSLGQSQHQRQHSPQQSSHPSTHSTQPGFAPPQNASFPPHFMNEYNAYYGHPLNPHQNPPNANPAPYQMGMPMRLAFGGLSAMAASNMFPQDDYKSLGALPIAIGSFGPQSIRFVGLALCAFSAFLSLLQCLPLRSKGEVRSPALNVLDDSLALLFLTTFSRRSLEPASVVEHVCSVFFCVDSRKSMLDLVRLYLKVRRCRKSVETLTLEALLARTLAVLKVFWFFERFAQCAAKQARDLCEKDSDTEFVAAIDKVMESRDVSVRLYNRFFSAERGTNEGVRKGRFEHSFEGVARDSVVCHDIAKFARNLRAYEMLRLYIETYVADCAREQSQELEERIEKHAKFLVGLQEVEKLAVEDSAVQLWTKLFMSLVAPGKIKETMSLVKKMADYDSHNEEINGVLEVKNGLEEEYEETEGEGVDEVEEDNIAQENKKKEENLAKEENADTEQEDGSDTRSESLLLDGSDDEISIGQSHIPILTTPDMIVNGEVLIALTSSLILDYIRRKEYRNAEHLLRHVLAYKNRFLRDQSLQITLLAFALVLSVISAFGKIVSEKKYRMDDKHVMFMESLIASARYWVGTESAITRNINELDDDLKADICDELVTFGVRFSGIEVD